MALGDLLIAFNRYTFIKTLQMLFLCMFCPAGFTSVLNTSKQWIILQNNWFKVSKSFVSRITSLNCLLLHYTNRHTRLKLYREVQYCLGFILLYVVTFQRNILNLPALGEEDVTARRQRTNARVGCWSNRAGHIMTWGTEDEYKWQ